MTTVDRFELYTKYRDTALATKEECVDQYKINLWQLILIFWQIWQLKVGYGKIDWRMELACAVWVDYDMNKLAKLS